MTRLVVWLIFWFAVAMLGAELLDFLETGRHSPMTLGGVWQALDATAHERFRDFIAHHAAWAEPVIRTILACPAWALLAASMLILILQGVRKRRRRAW